MARWVHTPEGQQWTVRRLILPDALRIEPFEAFPRRWVVARGTETRLLTVGVQHGVPPGSVQMFGAEGLVGIVVWVLLLLLAPLLVPLALLMKLALRRPWWVEAKSGGQIMRWRVRGFRNAARTVDAVAEAFEAGTRDPSPRWGERVHYWGPPALLDYLEAERNSERDGA
jgi:hypothetical protein